MSDPGRGVLRLRPGIEWRNVAGEVVALDLESSAYLAVNDTGSLLWPLVVAGTTEELLVDELVSRFAIDVDRARADVAAFVEGLRSHSLVEVGG